MVGDAVAGERTRVSLGTATPGGGFPVYGQAFAETINETDPSLAVEPRNTKGSAENVPLLESGQLDLALVQGESAYEALNGIGRPRAELRRSSSITRGTVRRWCWTDGSRRCGEAVSDGRRFSPCSRGRPAGGSSCRTPRTFQRILAKHAFLKTVTVPAGSFRGQDVPLATVGSWSFVMTRLTLPDDTAYRLAKALHRGESALGRRLLQGRETTAANTAAAAPNLDLIHPGVRRYLREIGALR
jgi:hypothetical protein